MEWLDTIFIILAAIAAFYFYVKHKQSYWERQGVPYVEPVILFGTAWAGLLKKVPFKDRLHSVYKELKCQGKFGGFYMFTSPAVMFVDAELVKEVLVKDFHHFVDRGLYYNEKSDPLSAHLVSLTGNKWRTLRAKIRPVFTSAKMKMMFPMVCSISSEFERSFREQADKDSTVEIKDLLARFTIDVIGHCAFGLECNSLKNPDTEFRQYGILTLQRTILESFKEMLLLTFPKIGKFFDMKYNNTKVASFYLRVVRETVEHREKNNVERNDFMNLLIGLKNSGEESERLTLNEISAQSFIFFLAGYETSSTTMMYCLYELALNPDIQEKTREHINYVLQKHNNEFTYEAMMDMTYLDQVIYEALRMYPVVTIHSRMCTKDYKIPESNVEIKEGTRTIIPVYGLHHDPSYFPNPNKFDPERFTKEAIASRPHYSYIPFGEGPRVCVGLRFGMMQVRVGLVALLRSLKFSPCAKTDIPLRGFSTILTVLKLEKGIHLKVEKV